MGLQRTALSSGSAQYFTYVRCVLWPVDIACGGAFWHKGSVLVPGSGFLLLGMSHVRSASISFNPEAHSILMLKRPTSGPPV